MTGRRLWPSSTAQISNPPNELKTSFQEVHLPDRDGEDEDPATSSAAVSVLLKMLFPRFDDGDVEIDFGNGAQDASSQNRRVFQLRFDKNGVDGSLMREWDEDTTELIKDTRPDAIDQASEHPHKAKNKRAQSQYAHQLLLSTLYHADTAVKPEWCEALQNYLEAFTNTADFYDCSRIARTKCDLLLRQRLSSVLKTCGEDPVRMIAFGLAIKSDWICKESSIHIVCRRETRYAEMLQRVKSEIADQEIVDFLVLGRTRFRSLLTNIELDLFTLSPMHPKREEHIAFATFCQWLANEPGTEHGSHLGNNYAMPYLLIEERNLRRLGLDHIHFLLTKQDVTKDMADVFQEALVRLSALVRPILKIDTDLKPYPRDHCNMRLHCSLWMEGMDLPWKKEP